MKKHILLFLIFSFISLPGYSQRKSKSSTSPKVIYKYKKYEKFDFEAIDLQSSLGNPGDLSVTPRYKVKFKNPLPYRKNFNSEIRKGIDRVR